MTLFQADFPQLRDRYGDALDGIRRTIREVLGTNLRSIYLLGSPARGHATVIRRGGDWEIANDLDFAIVVTRLLTKSQLLTLMDDCTRIVNPNSTYVRSALSSVDFHVDISQFAEAKVTNCSRTLFVTDWMHAGLLLEGTDVRKPEDYPLTAIPTIEAYMLIYNRMASLIELISSEDFSGPAPDDSSRWMMAYYFCRKAIIDAGAALLIGEHQYTPDYRERIVRLRPRSQSISDRYSWWVEYAAKLDSDLLDGCAMRQAWCEAYDTVDKVRSLLHLPCLAGVGTNPRIAISKWWRSRIAALMFGQGRSVSNASRVKSYVKFLDSGPSFQRRLSAYTDVETLAAEWRQGLQTCFRNTDLLRWHSQRNAVINEWKGLNWS